MPRRILQIYIAVSSLLIPWTLWLAYSLPVTHIDRKWNVTWVGFDVGLYVALALTAVLGRRGSGWTIMAATASATLLLADAWFDITTAGPGMDSAVSYLTAIVVELPLACLALLTAYHAGKRHLEPPDGAGVPAMASQVIPRT